MRGGMGNMQGMMKKMQKMQKEMTVAQDELNNKDFVGTASNELVTVTFTGDKNLKEVAIKPEVVDPEDVEMLEDLVLLAVNDALQKIDEETEQKMSKYSKGLPGM